MNPLIRCAHQVFQVQKQIVGNRDYICLLKPYRSHTHGSTQPLNISKCIDIHINLINILVWFFNQSNCSFLTRLLQLSIYINAAMSCKGNKNDLRFIFLCVGFYLFNVCQGPLTIDNDGKIDFLDEYLLPQREVYKRAHIKVICTQCILNHL